MKATELRERMKSLWQVNMGLKSGERALVFNDILDLTNITDEEEKARLQELPDLARRVAEEGGRLTSSLEYIQYTSTGEHGAEPPVSLWQAALGDHLRRELVSAGLLEPLLHKKADATIMKRALDLVRRNKDEVVQVVVGLANYSTTHTRFRTLLTEGAGVRYASMPLFASSMFAGPLGLDALDLARDTERVAQLLVGADEVFISTPLGTELKMKIGGRRIIADTGMLTASGACGNLPAGEVYLAPVLGSTEGKMLIVWGTTGRFRSPLTLHIAEGRCQDVTGDDPFRFAVLDKFKEYPQAANIAELGIGTNARASKPDNILESEKIMGTVHIALGDSAAFGGEVSVPFHRDFVLFDPTMKIVYAGGQEKIMLKDGKMQI